MQTSNAILSILTFLFVQIFMAASATNKSNKKCTTELDGIIHRPFECTKQYFETLSKAFQVQSEALYKSEAEADSFVFDFARNYQVNIAVINAMGLNTVYYPSGYKSERTYNQYSDTVQSFLNFPAFLRQASNSKFYYTFTTFSRDAQHYGITFILPLSRAAVCG